MEKWTVVSATALPMMRANIDTGALSPVIVHRKSAVSWSDRLFGNWRYDLDGDDIPDFPLNLPRYRQSKILVAGRNFACGSSREGAVWTLVEYGFRCVIAPSFGEIFYDNAFQNGLLLITLPDKQVEAIAAALEVADNPQLAIDLEACKIDLPNGTSMTFEVPIERRTALLSGTDELSQLLTYQPAVAEFRSRDTNERPWIYSAATGA
jgi:3-isopropylmalate/(R)-2-methylmalate dehydratase small subunit